MTLELSKQCLSRFYTQVLIRIKAILDLVCEVGNHSVDGRPHAFIRHSGHSVNAW